MARKRMIDPSFWTDEKLGEVEPRARLLFMGMISQADDEGRLNGHPALIKSLILPYDYEIEVSLVEEWINALATRKLIIRYEVGSQKYIAITNFKKHQTINRPQASKLPAPVIDSSQSDHGTFSDQSMNDHAQGKGKEGNLKEREENISEKKGTEEPTAPPDLETIKSQLFELIQNSNIKDYTLYDLDIIYSYIGVCDVEVIQTAIKKGSGKDTLRYAIKTLTGMVKEGKTKKEHVLPKIEVGQAPLPSNVTTFKRGKPVIPTVSSTESEPISPEELAEIRALARKMDEEDSNERKAASN